MRGRLLTILALLLCLSLPVRAGGPAYVAGSGYDPGVKGQPIVWAGNYVEYFTDQGDLSPILTNAQADAFVANAFSPWTSVLDSAFTASQAGHLAEDVNSTNVIWISQRDLFDSGRHSADRDGDAARNCLRLRRRSHRCATGRGRRRSGLLFHQRRVRRAG